MMRSASLISSILSLRAKLAAGWVMRNVRSSALPLTIRLSTEGSLPRAEESEAKLFLKLKYFLSFKALYTFTFLILNIFQLNENTM